MELTELMELRKNMLMEHGALSIELVELRKNMLMEHGAHGAYRAHGAEKEYAHGAWSPLSMKLIELRKNMFTEYRALSMELRKSILTEYGGSYVVNNNAVIDP